LKTTLAGLAAGLVLVAGYLGFCLATLPLGGGLVVEPTSSALVVEADNVQVFATRGVFKGEKVSSSDQPPDDRRSLNLRIFQDLISPGGSRWTNRRCAWLKKAALENGFVFLSPARRNRDIGAAIMHGDRM
jgi:hypothetical protein